MLRKRLTLYLIGFALISFAVIGITALLLFPFNGTYAQEGEELAPVEDVLEQVKNLPPDELYRAEVIEVIGETKDEDPNIGAIEQHIQGVRVRYLNGLMKGDEMELSYFPGSANSAQKLQRGDKVVVLKVYGIDMPSYTITDRYRLPSVGFITVIFVALVLLLARMTGARSLLGLAFSIFVVVSYIVPQILDGKNPLLISLVGGLIIACISIYVAHGVNLRSSIALAGTLITLALSIGLSIMAVTGASLFGTGSEEALYLQLGQTEGINLRGLLLGGIIVGLLGVLDDITTAQAAVVHELKKANAAFGFRELFVRGLSVGKEHIASLINTLALAYVGASFPLLLLFTQYKQPLWVILNNEPIAEEIIRTLVGSTALILAVPITTALAAYFFGKRALKDI